MMETLLLFAAFASAIFALCAFITARAVQRAEERIRVLEAAVEHHATTVKRHTATLTQCTHEHNAQMQEYIRALAEHGYTVSSSIPFAGKVH